MLFSVAIAASGQFPPPVAPAPAVHYAIQRKDAVAPGYVAIEADEKQEVDGPLRHFRGHVKIETSDMMLKADEVDFDQDTHDAEARGRVHFENFINGDKIDCDHAQYNTENETGKFYQIHGTSPSKVQARPGLLLTSNPFYFEGEWAERIQEKYILHNGFVTDCLIPRPWWVLHAPIFDIIPGDRAIAHKAVFRLRGVPLFYAPYFYKSLDKEPRRSGFLTPNIGNSSRRGFMIGAGFYWAINRSYDVLYRPQYFTARGFAHIVDFRGKIRPGTDFDFNFYGVNDRGIKIGNTLQKQGGYVLSVHAHSELGDGWTARAEINYLSSFLFRQSFSESIHEAVFSESDSVAYVTKHWSTFGVTAAVERDQNFEDTTPGHTIVIRALPQVDFNSSERLISDRVLPIWVSLESSAGFLNRQQPEFDTRQFAGRLDFNPAVTTAFRWAGFSIVPSFALHETAYDSSFVNGQVSGQNILRSAREFSVEIVPPSLARIFKAPAWLGEQVKHVIEPRIEYRYVGGVDDFARIIRFDETDILTDTNEVQVSVTNRLYTKQKDGAVEEVLTWEVRQSRYFDPSFGGAVVAGQRNVILSAAELTGYAFLDGPRNYSPIVSSLRVHKRIGFEWRTDYDPLRGGIVNSGLTADARFASYFLSVGHNQVRENPVVSPPSNQIRGTLGWGDQNRRGWNAGFSIYYDYRRDVVQFANTQVTYNTDCCGFSMQYRRSGFGSLNENQYRFAFAVSNFGTIGTLKRQERIF